MTEVLQDKSLATKFQIIVEIAAGQPSIQQREIASKLNVSRQAISQYIEKLIEEGLVTSDGRSRYSLTKEAVNWILKTLRELESYSASVKKTVTNITICAAVAESDLNKGQVVTLEMENGILVARSASRQGAKGMVVNDARKGEDVGISNIDGIVPLDHGKITILRIPAIQNGGSKNVNLDRLKHESSKKRPYGAIGIEALAALRKIGIEPQYLYGVAEAAIEAAHSGLPFLIICVDDAVPELIKKLGDERLVPELFDLSLYSEQ